MAIRPEDFTEQGQEVRANSQEIVRRFRHTQWDVEHVLLALLELEKGVPVQIFTELGADIERIKAEVQEALEGSPKTTYEGNQIYATPRASRLVESAKEEADRLHDDYIGSEHLLIAVTLDEQGEAALILQRHQIGKEQVYQALQQVRGAHRVTDPRAESHYQTLARYTVDLTELARESKLDPVIGRRGEIRRVMQTAGPAHQEQSGDHRRRRRGQDRDRRGVGPGRGQRRRAHAAPRPPRAGTGDGQHRGRQQIPGRV